MNKVLLPTLLATAIAQAIVTPVIANEAPDMASNMAQSGTSAAPDGSTIEHLVVSSDFRGTSVEKLPASVTSHAGMTRGCMVAAVFHLPSLLTGYA